MVRWFVACGAIAVCVAIGPSLGAQWPSHPTPGVPRTAEGNPILDAPTPRTPDGKPDLSGIWRLGFGGFDGARSGEPAGPAFSQGPPVSQFFEVAGRGNPLPIQPWAAELKKKRMADNSKDNPDVWCLPIGLMQYHNHPQPRQIVQTKNLMLITYEANYGLRYIYLDGRPAPNNDPTPWWFGYSRGWWEGDTLVVETTNFLGDEKAGWLDVNGSPYTDALKMTERFRRPNFGTLEIDITIDDAKAYTTPFTVRVNHRILVDGEMMEFICNENEKSTNHIEAPAWMKK
ncbi:MAG TPA: hypothetical protein VFS23_17665 [Vicinamibacterales bacterium]|nr:hypothetical protein [Vicinamibacterales bacterium]